MGDPVSWLVIEAGWKVLAANGREVGQVDEVVGDSNADIFDGLAIATSRFGKPRYVPSEQVDEITEGTVRLSLTLAQVDQLGEYLEPATSAQIEPNSKGGIGESLSSEARELVERAAHGTNEHTYGINTGFGRFVSRSIPEELAGELQLRLLRSHACGVGEPYPDDVVRAAMLLRANALAKGFSGARPQTVELLIECLNRGVLPHVPSRGSVGASGDLAPLAHLALPLVGEGEAWVEDTRLDGAAALAAVGLEPISLEAKEGLSLVNGTQFMAAFSSMPLALSRRLATTADIAFALSLHA